MKLASFLGLMSYFASCRMSALLDITKSPDLSVTLSGHSLLPVVDVDALQHATVQTAALKVVERIGGRHFGLAYSININSCPFFRPDVIKDFSVALEMNEHRTVVALKTMVMGVFIYTKNDL